NFKMDGVEGTGKRRDFWIASTLALATLIIFYLSIKATQQHFDYTSRIASALLEGHVGLQKPAPSWLNEMVPQNGHYYSVFALGIAFLGEIAALYFVLVDPRPVIAGAFFALAIGNRTEIALCLPIFLYLLLKQAVPEAKGLSALAQHARQKSRMFIYFLIVPVALGLLTALYNYARFHSFFDFGYSHI